MNDPVLSPEDMRAYLSGLRAEYDAENNSGSIELPTRQELNSIWLVFPWPTTMVGLDSVGRAFELVAVALPRDVAIIIHANYPTQGLRTR